MNANTRVTLLTDDGSYWLVHDPGPWLERHPEYPIPYQSVFAVQAARIVDGRVRPSDLWWVSVPRVVAYKIEDA